MTTYLSYIIIKCKFQPELLVANMFKVVIADNDALIIHKLKMLIPFNNLGYQIDAEFSNLKDTVSYFKKNQVDLLITDVKMNGSSGFELLKIVKNENKDLLIIVISACSNYEYVREAMKLGANDYLLKPLDFNEMTTLLNDFVNKLNRRKVFNNQTEDNPNMNESFKALLDYMRENYYKQLSLFHLCEIFYINFTYCCGLFKKYTGRTYHEFLTELRMTKAKQLLLDENKTVKEVAIRVGFNDYYYFIKAFKKYFGTTPKSLKNYIYKEKRDG